MQTVGDPQRRAGTPLVRTIIRPGQLRYVPLAGYTILQIERLMTPGELLQKEELPLPQMITPDVFTNFNSLFIHRERMRDLKLVPIKAKGPHEEYNALSREALLDEILSEMGSDRVIMAENKYPYSLPSDLAQWIVWVRDSEEHPLSHREIAMFIGRAVDFIDRSPDDIILFERPRKSMSKLVKGSFKQLRHLHLFTHR